MHVVAEVDLIESRQGICYRAGISATSASFSTDGNHIGKGLQQESHYRFLSATPCVHTPHLGLKPEPRHTACHITRVHCGTDDASVREQTSVTQDSNFSR